MQHRGFALIDTFSPCVTYNHDNTYDFFKQRTRKLEEMDHDPTDFHAAMEKGYLWGEVIPIGLFWRREDLPALDQLDRSSVKAGRWRIARWVSPRTSRRRSSRN
jgi:2-oxoglutarate ferredoxin oxidoreductase subunit beta